jgi:hypothetical protein
VIDEGKLEEAARTELALLWRDLESACRAAADGRWSMRCDSVVDRIKALTALVGPTPWDEVPPVLVETRLYQEIHLAIGIDTEVKAWQIAEAKALAEIQRRA